MDPTSLSIVQCNQAAAEVMGYTRAEMCSLRVQDVATELDESRIADLIKKIWAGETVQIETRERRKDGELRNMHVSVVLLETEEGALFHATHSDLTDIRLAQDSLRIAATAFESHSGIVVMDSNRIILRVNRAFTEITGYSQEYATGKTSAFLASDRNPPSLHQNVWVAVERFGKWEGQGWHRRKNGEHYMERSTVTAVHSVLGETTHYVAFLTDATIHLQQEAIRLASEDNHRKMLVQEVHHRIKNSLQGILGILREYVNWNPEISVPLEAAIAQVKAISLVHGLQGTAENSMAPIAELVQSIAGSVGAQWRAPISVDILCSKELCVAEGEMVPVALILNELITNAVKHGGKAHGRVLISLLGGLSCGSLQIRICNSGLLPPRGGETNSRLSGLHLIEVLLPHAGANFIQEQQGGQVVTLLQLFPPVLLLHATPVVEAISIGN